MLIFSLLGAVAVSALGLVCPLVLPYASLPCILAAPLAAAPLAAAPLAVVPLAAAPLAVVPLAAAPLAAASIYSWFFL